MGSQPVAWRTHSRHRRRAAIMRCAARLLVPLLGYKPLENEDDVVGAHLGTTAMYSGLDTYFLACVRSSDTPCPHPDGEIARQIGTASTLATPDWPSTAIRVTLSLGSSACS